MCLEHSSQRQPTDTVVPKEQGHNLVQKKSFLRYSGEVPQGTFPSSCPGRAEALTQTEFQA